MQKHGLLRARNSCAVRIWEERSQENPPPPLESANACQQQ
jgi:hypothetical protein